MFVLSYCDNRVEFYTITMSVILSITPNSIIVIRMYVSGYAFRPKIYFFTCALLDFYKKNYSSIMECKHVLHHLFHLCIQTNLLSKQSELAENKGDTYSPYIVV